MARGTTNRISVSLTSIGRDADIDTSQMQTAMSDTPLAASPTATASATTSQRTGPTGGGGRSARRRRRGAKHPALGR